MEYVEGTTGIVGEVCPVCAGRAKARQQARYFLDHVVREIGT